MFDHRVDDMNDAPRVNPAIVTVKIEDVLVSPAPEERDTPRDPVHLAEDLVRGHELTERSFQTPGNAEDEQLFAVLVGERPSYTRLEWEIFDDVVVDVEDVPVEAPVRDERSFIAPEDVRVEVVPPLFIHRDVVCRDVVSGTISRRALSSAAMTSSSLLRSAFAIC